MRTINNLKRVAAIDYSKTSNQALSVDPASNRLLGFTHTLTCGTGDKTRSSTSQINYSLDQNGNLTSDGLRTFDYDANIGCITHLQSGTATPVRHWIEVLDEALQETL